jgi:hypothetical protein
LFEGGSYLDGVTTDHEHDHDGFPSTRPGTVLRFLSAFSFDHSSSFNSPMTGDARMKIDDNGPVGDIDEALGIV